MERQNAEDDARDRDRVANVGVDEEENSNLDDLGSEGGEEIAVDDVE